jgi:hypothetical protein
MKFERNRTWECGAREQEQGTNHADEKREAAPPRMGARRGALTKFSRELNWWEGDRTFKRVFFM